jgi:hypothetical protein
LLYNEVHLLQWLEFLHWFIVIGIIKA